jgi:hypothetical protein
MIEMETFESSIEIFTIFVDDTFTLTSFELCSYLPCLDVWHVKSFQDTCWTCRI